MKKPLSPAERLVVAADFRPEPNQDWRWVEKKVLDLADSIEGTGVYLKVNSALRAVGYSLIQEIHERGLKVFADLKLFDIGETLATDGAILRRLKPEILTTVCMVGVPVMEKLKDELPDTEILGVTVLTSLGETDTQSMFLCSTRDAVLRFGQYAFDAQIDGLICSGKEAQVLRAMFGSSLSLNAPAIRPSWAEVKGDDQNKSRTMTPAEAIAAGIDRIIVGRPITQSAKPKKAVMKTLEEISSVPVPY